jgi:hypothetical protein
MTPLVLRIGRSRVAGGVMGKARTKIQVGTAGVIRSGGEEGKVDSFTCCKRLMAKPWVMAAHVGTL